MTLLIGWLVLALLVGVVAGARGRSGFGWFLFACVLSPLIGFIVVALLPSLQDTQGRIACPACKELVLEEALKCKHCGTALTPASNYDRQSAVEPARPPSNAACAAGRVLGRLVGRVLDRLFIKPTKASR